jgi:hypothetical protein
MRAKAILKDGVIGAISGYAGVQAMSPVTTKLQAMESPQDAEREKRVSPIQSRPRIWQAGSGRSSTTNRPRR